MILLNVVPCLDCEYYDGIKKPDKDEKKEYISCNESKTGDASDLLFVKDGTCKCNKFAEVEE